MESLHEKIQDLEAKPNKDLIEIYALKFYKKQEILKNEYNTEEDKTDLKFEIMQMQIQDINSR